MNQLINTESPSHYDDLEKKSVLELITDMNKEDAIIAQVVKSVLPQIEQLICAALKKMQGGGRVFYIGAGTSGRLGVLDASEIPPTYGVDEGMVIGIIAGGDQAIRKAIEFAEDDPSQAWIDLSKFNINTQDFLIGIAASGETPYVLGGIAIAKQNGIATGCIVCNQHSSIAKEADYPIELLTGPEFVTGSTRMKSGTAQKLVLNMISTAVMIQLGRVEDNKMVNMQLTNEKLIDRGVKMLIGKVSSLTYEDAKSLLMTYGSVKKAVESLS